MRQNPDFSWSLLSLSLFSVISLTSNALFAHLTFDIKDFGLAKKTSWQLSQKDFHLVSKIFS